MASWHKRARLGVATFGVAVAVIVYFAMGERQIAAPPEPVKRMDPRALIEAYSSIYERTTGLERNFNITFERSQTYDDGSTKGFGVTITVPKGENRTFTVTATEAYSGKDQTEYELSAGVKLQDSDGFVLTTERGTYNQQSIARAPGAVDFGKGRMTGSGVDIIYDQANNVLTIAQQAHVSTRDEEGGTVMEFTAGSATLDRTQHILTLSSNVHIVRGDQVIDADLAVARLSENDDVVQFVELRGNSRVQGGDSAIDAMSARDIDLDYTDDGVRLEAVSLDGNAAVAMTPQGEEGGTQQIVSDSADLALAADGSSHIVLVGRAALTMAGTGGAAGRKFAGETLELDLAPDGTLTRAVGRDNVRLDLPGAADGPVRSIRAATLNGVGQTGAGLTSATFTGDVVFTETARAPAGAATRTARAQTLEARLADDAVTDATFTGDVTFEETGLKACAGRLAYRPEQGMLTLAGTTAAGAPMVAEEQITVEAQAIDVALEGRRMQANGAVNTRMGAATRCRPTASRPAAERGATRMPGLLKQDTAATISAAALDYQGASGTAVYTGRAILTQGETTIHADTIRIDQSNGDLTATGNAISTMTLDSDVSIGRAHEMRYVDKTRRITYAAAPASSVVPPPASAVAPPPAGAVAAPPTATATPPATGRGAAVVAEPQLSGAQGDLRARRIDLVLGADSGSAERIEARTNVRVTQGGRVVTGGATLTYEAAERKYVVSGEGTVPVTIVDKQNCRESSGRSVTFFTSDDRLIIDGENRNRAQTNACGTPAR